MNMPFSSSRLARPVIVFVLSLGALATAACDKKTESAAPEGPASAAPAKAGGEKAAAPAEGAAVNVGA